MKRIYALLLIGMLLLSSCSLGELNMKLFVDSDSQLADKRMEEILKALKNEDRETVKSMFSTKARTEATDFDGGIEYLFSFFQGEIESWKRTTGPGVFEEKHHGARTKKMVSWYSVNTSTQKYLVFILENAIDTEHPENVGLFSLRVIKAEDEGTQFTYWQNMESPGVYQPDI